MAKKYSKYTSNYILSQEHKRTEKGVINLRDWTTIGEIERLDKGKKPVFGNGNFKFTIRNVASNPTKHITSKFVGTFEYNDVKDALPQNNLTELNLFTNDLRDYAYYGSATELIRSTIQHIIKNFPSRIKISNERMLNRKEFHYNGDCLSVSEVVDLDFNEDVDVFDENIKTPQIEYLKDGENEYTTVFLLDNPFEIDLHHEGVLMNEYSNPHRYLTYSFKDYIISEDGINFEEIDRYSVNIEFNNINRELEYTRGRFNCVFDSCQIADVIIKTKKNSYQLKGYLFDNKIKWGYDCIVEVNNGYEKRKSQLFIQPKQEIIDKYFNSLQGLEKILLRRDTHPLYLCKLKTPIIQSDIMMTVDRSYQFPSEDGFIDVTSPLFTSYINNLYEIASIWDQTYTDNLLQKMTHEAIKNYDWSYKRDVDVNESEEMLIGGLRVENLLHVYGRLFDDIKHYIDGIKNAHIITYDGYNNMPNAHITDELEENGWHIVNTIPILDVKNDENEITSKEFTNQVITEELIDVKGNELNWFKSRNKKHFNWVQNNLNFMKKLKLNSNYIFRSKGTKKSIEMIMGMFGLGENDFEIGETYYKTTPIRYDQDTETKFDNLVSSFDGLLNEDNPDGALPIRIKKYYHTLQSGEVEEVEYIVPFLNYNNNADVDLYFQSKGGWCKYSVDENRKDYIETMSYLRIKYTLSELFTISPSSVKDGDVFYVVDLTDYVNNYNQTPTSHYFAMTDISSIYNSKGWTNINPFDSNHKIYNEYIDYMEGIIATNLGNNPHIGFGRYDMGEYYIENMRNPFKYAIENCTTYYDEYGIYESEQEQKKDLELFKFDLDEDIVTGTLVSGKNYNSFTHNDRTYYCDEFGNILLLNESGLPYQIKDENGNNIYGTLVSGKNYYSFTHNDRTYYCDEFGNILLPYQISFNTNKVFLFKDKEPKNYYINSKVVKIVNKHKPNIYFSEYFKEVILPYIQQVVPTTTILQFINF